MSAPQVPIDVDDRTGEWRVDGMPMVLVPRHFLLNNHEEIEAALGREPYRELLFRAGHKSAYEWCGKEAVKHRLSGVAVFHHYLRRLSQRGWAQFSVRSLDERAGTGLVELRHSIFVTGRRSPADHRVCYMFRGWFCGALEWVGHQEGRTHTLTADETRCVATDGGDCCVFEIRPAG